MWGVCLQTGAYVDLSTGYNIDPETGYFPHLHGWLWPTFFCRLSSRLCWLTSGITSTRPLASSSTLRRARCEAVVRGCDAVVIDHSALSLTRTRCHLHIQTFNEQQAEEWAEQQRKEVCD